MHSSIHGTGHESLWVEAFSILQLTQDRKESSIFRANKLVQTHTAVAGLMTFCPSIPSVATH